MSGGIRDLRQALRVLRIEPLSTLVIVLALALGTGFNSAIFSVVNAWLLRPLPYAEADRLTLIFEDEMASPQEFGFATSWMFDKLEREAGSLELLATQRSRGATPTELRIPSPLVWEVSELYFKTFGLEPRLGRVFTREEHQPGGPKRVILSHSFWQNHLGGDPAVLGETLELDFEPYEIVGILPERYHSPIQREPPQLWMPLALDPRELDRQSRRYLVYGRLASGVSLEQARGELARILEQARELDPEAYSGRELRMRLVQDVLSGPVRSAILMLFGAVAFVLLVACCNVANLLSARILSRRQEMAVRSAMGAGRGELVRQLLAENLVLALCGAGLGLVMAIAALRVLETMIPPEPGAPWLGLVVVDRAVFLFTLTLASSIGVALALIQAHQSFSRTDLAAVLRSSTSSTAEPGRKALRGALVILEVGLALVLVIGAGLMVRSFLDSQSQDPGFATHNILTLRTAVRGEAYQTGAQITAFFERVLAKLGALPGVELAAVISFPPPILPVGQTSFSVVGAPPAEQGFAPQAIVQAVSPDYFATLAISVLRGRSLKAEDRAEGELVAVANRLFAQRYLSHADPIGQVARFADGSERKIVGVVADVRTAGRPPDPVPTLYLPHAQKPDAVLSYVIRTGSEPRALLPQVLRTITDQDPLMPIYRVMTMEETLASVDWQPRLRTELLGFFALVALFLATTGIYAVMAMNVTERRRELVIRVALGARPSEVVGLVLRHAALLVGLGIVFGVLAAGALARWLRAELHGVDSGDPWTYAGLSLLLAVVAMVASGTAAFKALRVDPALALREP